MNIDREINYLNSINQKLDRDRKLAHAAGHFSLASKINHKRLMIMKKIDILSQKKDKNRQLNNII